MPSDGFFKNLVKGFSKKPPDLAEQSPKPKMGFILGAEPREKLDPWWWLVVAVVVLLVLLMAIKPDPYWNIFLFVRDGLAITVELTAISFVFILIVGLIGGLGRIAKNPIIHFIATIYVEVIRGIPLLVQLIWWYFAAPVIIQDYW